MACSCGKKKRRPAAPAKPKTDDTDTKAGQAKGKTQAFTLTTWAGQTHRFGSRLEADAFNRRAGGGGTVRPA